ncbi:hypothetical protein [Streptomyces sp. SID3343]|uniref:hypothetical protein n=1 Tax=Streptomyces sp. SID3343 TaxID=2690260 RepID=UPI001371BDD2|nr:hypothetical protein [Streptomyces sp. SID3343]MYW02339.1 hypothetical protein [Streptomyces sp. SID3343]
MPEDPTTVHLPPGDDPSSPNDSTSPADEHDDPGESDTGAQVPPPRHVFVVVEGVAGTDVVATRLARALGGERINGPLDAGPGATADPECLAEALVGMAVSIASGVRVHPVVVSGYLVSVTASAGARAGLSGDEALGLFAPYLEGILVPDLTVHLHAGPEPVAELLAASPSRVVEAELVADPALRARRLALQDELAALDTTALHLPISDIDPDGAVEVILRTLVDRAAESKAPATT